MNKSVISALAALVVFLAAPALNPGPAAGEFPEETALGRLPAEQQKKLLAGEEVYEPRLEDAAGEAGFTAAAMIIINAPVEQCFDMFCDFEKQYLYFPQISKSSVRSRSQDRVVIQKELDYRVVKIRYTHILTIDPQNHRVGFVTDPKGVNDVKFSKGFFQFQPIDDNRTLFTYGMVKLDPGIRVPQFIRKYMISRDLPKMAVNLKKWIESDGKWKK